MNTQLLVLYARILKNLYIDNQKVQVADELNSEIWYHQTWQNLLDMNICITKFPVIFMLTTTCYL